MHELFYINKQLLLLLFITITINRGAWNLLNTLNKSNSNESHQSVKLTLAQQQTTLRAINPILKHSQMRLTSCLPLLP